jgi:aminopeptidase
MHNDRINHLTRRATEHVGNIVRQALEYAPPRKALVVYDTSAGLARILTEAYRTVLPHATFIDFDTVTKEDIIGAFNSMEPNDLVVLIQSSNFLLNEFRIRLHLFSKKLKVIEHMHLYRNTEDVWDVYIEALAYDTSWYRTVGPKLKARLENIQELCILAPGTALTFSGGVESPKLNIGDYRGMENIGGTFPIGEVFTEGKDFSRINGSVMIYAFAGGDFCVGMYEPFRVDITEGIVSGWGDNAPKAFIDIVAMVRSYERPLIREIGFGLNRAITKERYLEDITAFERILGLHLSMGEKHSVYKKEGIPTHKTKFHVDLFPLVEKITADGAAIFENGAYVL